MCRSYDAYNCWYKRCFVTEQAPEAYRLDMARFKTWANEIQFAEDGNIVWAPDFESSREMLKDMPIEPRFQLLTETALAADSRLADAAQEQESKQE